MREKVQQLFGDISIERGSENCPYGLPATTSINVRARHCAYIASK